MSHRVDSCSQGNGHYLKNKVLPILSKGNIESSNGMRVAEGEWGCIYLYLKTHRWEIWGWGGSGDMPFSPIFFFFLMANLLRHFNSALKEKSLACKAASKLLCWDTVTSFASCCVAAWYLVLRTKPLSSASRQETTQQTSEGKREREMPSSSTEPRIQC